MGQVTVQLNGRNYRLSCGDGEEGRLLELADFIRQRIDDLSFQFKNSGDERLLLMAAIMITDELWDTQARLAALEGATSPALTDRAGTSAMPEEPPLVGPPSTESISPPPTETHLPDPPDEAHVHEPSLKRALRRQQATSKGSFTERLAVAQGTKSSG
jgi:cell division protein ZapA